MFQDQKTFSSSCAKKIRIKDRYVPIISKPFKESLGECSFHGGTGKEPKAFQLVI